MKEYIEREAAIQALGDEPEMWYERDPVEIQEQNDWNYYKHCIEAVPAADVVEVRHGRWLTTDAYPHHLYCSVCYKTYAKNAKWVNELDLPTNYCPSCGARMDKEDEHEAD